MMFTARTSATSLASTSATSQLRALLSLRWRMVRSPQVRLIIRLAALLLVYVLFLAARSAGYYDVAALGTAIELAPQAFLAFGILAVVAPLTAGGGNELFPPDQLVAYPITARTHFLGGLVLAPVNLIWVLQIIALVAESAYLTAGGDPVLGALTSASFVVALTTSGQALAWSVAGLRQTRGGRRVVLVLGAAGLIGGLLVVRSDNVGAVLDHAPTGMVVDGVIAGAHNDLLRWSVTTGVLLLMAVAGLLLGARACNWALRRPGDAGALRESRPVVRRQAKGGQLRELVAIDRGSVWRAPALRRGGLVLAVLPGIAAAGAAVPWASLIILPGLVAAGAGLLFGVNAFCLDGSGAIWLASLPHRPSLVAQAKTIVLAETVLAATVVAAVAGSLRSPGTPTATELSGILMSGLSCYAFVVATCLSMSVRHPHRADLKGARDAVAPPGALVLASVQLAMPAGFIGLLFEGAASSGLWWAPLVLAVPVLLGSALWIRHSLASYEQPLTRARIVQVVASG
jgi:hypothetical protein